MSGPINTSSFGKALWPGLNAWFGERYNAYMKEYMQIFDEFPSRKHYEEDVGVTGFGLVPIKEEGAATEYDTQKQNYVSRYTHVEYSLGYIVTQVEIEDNLYPELTRGRTQNLAFVFNQTKEIVCANVLNRGFNASYPGGDNVSLFNDSHPIAGGTFANTPVDAGGSSIGVDLSEAALEQALIDIAGFVDDRGNIINVMGRKLIVPKELDYTAERILKNPLRPATSDRDINAMYQMGRFPDGYVVNHFLTDTNAWFIKTDVQDGLKMFNRVALTFSNDNDFDTDNLKYKGRERYSVGWTDPRGGYGSQGA